MFCWLLFVCFFSVLGVLFGVYLCLMMWDILLKKLDYIIFVGCKIIFYVGYFYYLWVFVVVCYFFVIR